MIVYCNLGQLSRIPTYLLHVIYLQLECWIMHNYAFLKSYKTSTIRVTFNRRHLSWRVYLSKNG